MIIWLAYYSDWSDFALFETEIEALRHAVAHSMQVRALTLPQPSMRGEK